MDAIEKIKREFKQSYADYLAAQDVLSYSEGKELSEITKTLVSLNYAMAKTEMETYKRIIEFTLDAELPAVDGIKRNEWLYNTYKSDIDKKTA